MVGALGRAGSCMIFKNKQGLDQQKRHKRGEILRVQTA